MTFFEQADEKLAKEIKGISDQKGLIMKEPVRKALLDFALQQEEFTQAIVQGGSFADCMRKVCAGVGNSISDLEAYSRAAAFYFPGCKIRMQMSIDLIGDAASAQPESGRKGLILNLSDFF